MVLNGFSRNFKPLEILTDEQVQAIHRGTLDVLQKTGLRIEHEKGLKVFEENGCDVDFDESRVRFPPGLVEECLRKAPSAFRVKARDSGNDMIWGGNTSYFQPIPGQQTIDLDTWDVRDPTRQEFYDTVKVLDALENVHLVPWYTPWFGFKNVPSVMAMLEGFAARLRNSSKFVCANYQKGCEVFMIKMAKALGIEYKSTMAAAPPLTFYGDAIQNGFRILEAGFPLQIVSGATYGGTSPATIAGSVIENNAEIIGGIIFAQLVEPGSRVIAQDFSFPMDMVTGSPAFGAIGISLHMAAFNQIWRKYDIPTDAGNYHASKMIDYQGGYEKAIMTYTAAITGTHTIWNQGALYGEKAFHPVQAIIDDDLVGMIGRFIEGVKVDEETLAVDLIDETGPIPGMYLNKAHTREWWKREQFVPKVADRYAYPEWKRKGKKSLVDHAKERMAEILEKHEPKPLTDDEEDAIENILQEARKYYRKEDMISEKEWKKYQADLESSGYPFS